MKKNIVIYNKTTKIVENILKNAEIFQNEIISDNHFLKIDPVEFWNNFDYITISDTYDFNNIDHIEPDGTVVYKTNAYVVGELILDSANVVGEYDVNVINQNSLNKLVKDKIRKTYSVDNENELNRKINAISQNLLDPVSSEGAKAIADFSAYNTFVEQCISEAKIELGL